MDVLEIDRFIGDWLRSKDSCEICGGIVKGEAEGKAEMENLSCHFQKDVVIIV